MLDMIRRAACILAALALTPSAFDVAQADPELVDGSVAQAQTTISAADIQRLQDRIYDAGSDLSRLRSRDADLALRQIGRAHV